MPELPEVETILRGLRDQLLNLTFSRIEVRLKKSIANAPQSFASFLPQRKILSVERRGKNIIFHLSGGTALLVHLRMTGSLRFMPAKDPVAKHTHVIFSFRNSLFQLRFIDPRQFGRLILEKKQRGENLKALVHLGPEPLAISFREFSKRLVGRRRAIKSLLLDQSFLAGVGNIYADETLHRAGIHPRQRADTLGEKDLRRLCGNLKKTLREAIRAGGTSVRNYVDAHGSPGGFQKSLSVYGRKGEKCPACGSTITRERVGGRSSFYCPKCQPLLPQ